MQLLKMRDLGIDFTFALLMDAPGFVIPPVGWARMSPNKMQSAAGGIGRVWDDLFVFSISLLYPQSSFIKIKLHCSQRFFLKSNLS